MNDYHDLGLPADLAMWTHKPVERRRVLQLGALGIGTLLAGCASGQITDGVSACLTEIPEETAGPYPADGSSGMGGGPGSNTGTDVNVLERSGIVRSDITSSLETGSVAEGVPATIELTLFDLSNDCAPLVGYAVYLWHCDRAGAYSMYSSGVEDEDYLRGVQETDEGGKVRFTSIFPACYSGRWPHIHFEVYPSLAVATNAENKIHTSQLALPEDVCTTVFETAEGYSQSLNNLAQTSLDTDNVFSDDDAILQLATVTGSVAEGYAIELSFGIES